jgi:hypothetical protein
VKSRTKRILLKVDELSIFKISHNERKIRKIDIGRKVSVKESTPVTVERIARFT